MREEKNLSQGDVEKRTGLLRCYISRVENGHTVPTVETLEKMAIAFGVPMYQLFYDGEEPREALIISKPGGPDAWGSSGPASRYLLKLRRCLAQMKSEDRTLFMSFAQKVANRRR